MHEAARAADEIGLPVIVRPSFTLGGHGGGMAYNREEYDRIVAAGLAASPVHSVLVEESVLGWKEFEMEVVRDKADNCIIVCSIENVDPMGVHTGDSITVAPALTLTDKEYQIMRDASIACLREIGVETGGSNVQFAVDPDTGRLVVIEMNPRVSRSSALASKATGFPIAKVAAKLAVGYTLDELTNDITGVTPAAFEPTIDYVVTKLPRFTFEKFPDTDPILSSSMKSVGEAMAIGRTFAESLQKGLRSLETGLTGLDEVEIPGAEGPEAKDAIRAALAAARPERILTVAQAFRHGLTMEEIRAACHFDPWFLERIHEIVREEDRLRADGLPTSASALVRVKAMGFSDERLSALTGKTMTEVVFRRQVLNVHPVYKRIDTCAGEFPSRTPYMYSCYEGNGIEPAECESEPTDRTKVVILGGGPNRIGQGIEFDYCCVHAAYALSDAGFETIMINCNPETVSTDYDTSDRLYFEPLTAEDVIEAVRREQSSGTVLGVIVQFGGQTPLKLARSLEAANIPILGTTPDSIDLAEDRKRFQGMLHELDLKQPRNDTVTSLEEARVLAARIGYPVVLRPSYVLGGRAMQIVYSEQGLERYMTSAVLVSGDSPVLIDAYLEGAVEVDVDAVCDGSDVYIAGIMQHIEEAGVHSGDSACTLPPFSIEPELIEEMKVQTRALALRLGVVGLMNIQFALKDGIVYLLEVNPRASRTVPFVAKATGVAVAKIAARVMAGAPLAGFGLSEKPLGHVAVKEAVFPFARFPGVDIVLGPEMKSTGEVMGIDHDLDSAFAKSQIGAGSAPPLSGTVFLSVRDQDKLAIVEEARLLADMGFRILATRGTAGHLETLGIPVEIINKVREGRPHCVDAMISGQIQMVINTTAGAQSLKDSFDIRRTALMRTIPHYTTLQGARAAVRAIAALKREKLDVRPLQSYFER